MKAMILSDFTMIKSYIPQQALLGLIMSIFLCYGMDTTVVIIPAMTFAGAFSIIFTIVSLDESNDWERYRLSLPISRTKIVIGRYLSSLLYTLAFMAVGIIVYILVNLIIQTGIIPVSATLLAEANAMEWTSIALLCAVILISLLAMNALILPFTLQFGMTKAVRLLPLALIAIVFIGSFVIGAVGDGLSEQINNLFIQLDTPEGILGVITIALVVIASVYSISCFVSTRLYQSREF